MLHLNSQTGLPANTQTEPTLILAMQECLSFLQKRAGAKALDAGQPANVGIEFELDQQPGYQVDLDGKSLRFRGEQPVDILYAVYTFAEEILGFCFFEPGQDRVPATEEIQLTEGELISRRTPLLRNRGLIQEFPPSQESFVIADWMARNRLNYLLTWMKYYDQFSPEMKEYYRVRGIEVESGHHNFEYFIPLEKYHKEHPEYFAELNGQRVRPEEGDGTLFLSKQLCVTNPGLREEFARNMIAYAKAHPELSTISLIPNDGFGWCECEQCSTFYDKNSRGELFSVSEHVYPAQDIYHDFAQDIAARVHKELPNLTISLAAYVNYIHPSKNLRLTEGMAVHVAPYWRCINHELHDPECPINRRYWEALKEWSASKQGGTFNIYEYYMGVNFYLSLPMVHHRAVFRELRALHEIGADGILTQFHLPHWTAYGLNYYSMAKAAWGEDQETAVNRAFQGIFGEDANEADELYELLHDICRSLGPCHIPIPRSFLLRLEPHCLEEVSNAAIALAEKQPNDPFRRNLVLWMEYIISFKSLFDRYQAGEDVRPGLQHLIEWTELHASHNIALASKLKTYFGAWSKAIEEGKTWYHFNIGWEDEYVKRYDQLLNEDW